MEKKTHVLVNEPEISIQKLADYMAGSERAKRSLSTNLKYKPIARLVQHQEARLVISKFFVKGKTDANELAETSEFIRNKLADDDFDILVNEANAGYVARVSQILGDLNLPKANLPFAQKTGPFNINGVKLTFRPQIYLDRTAKGNKPKRGALMFRYAKGKALNPQIAKYQSAGIFGVLREFVSPEAVDEFERGLCVTVDAHTGEVHPAQGDAINDFKNMKAALATLAERWPVIKPPPKAVL